MEHREQRDLGHLERDSGRVGWREGFEWRDLAVCVLI